MTHLALLGRADSWTDGSSTGAQLSLGGSGFGLLYSALYSRFSNILNSGSFDTSLEVRPLLRLTSILKYLAGVPGTCLGSQN